jgi:hypothetical protein
MLVHGPEVMDMGSKGVVLLEVSWQMWWSDAWLGPTAQGVHVMAEKYLPSRGQGRVVLGGG